MVQIVSGDCKRIFLNTAIGCKAGCSYCYLGELGIREVIYYSAEEVLEELKKNKQFISGRDGTILSIGCYSECMDLRNKEQTMKILREIIPYGNYIQISTKQAIDKEAFCDIDKKLFYPGQLNIYVSMTSASEIDVLEPGTAGKEIRIRNLSYQSCFQNIRMHLYIKPVIEDVSIHDLEIFENIMTSYNINAVVGEKLKSQEVEKGALRIGEHYFTEESNSQSEVIRMALSKYGKVYKNSTEMLRG